MGRCQPVLLSVPHKPLQLDGACDSILATEIKELLDRISGRALKRSKFLLLFSLFSILLSGTQMPRLKFLQVFWAVG